jgi:hypothetical protein
MFDDSSHAARLREAKCRSHRRRARFWLFLLIAVSGLFYSLILVNPIPLTILLWWVITIIWRVRLRHLLSAEGYARPFAEEIVAKARNERGKFALFLRGFNLEAQSFRVPLGRNVEFGFGKPTLSGLPLEALLVQMLSENLPLIALPNPNDLRPMGEAHRFQSVPANWKHFVSNLLPDAFPVIMHLTTSFSLGVLEELELLKHPDCAKKTVIIVGRNVAVEESEDGKWVQRTLATFGYVVFQQTSAVWSRKHEIYFYHRLLECFQTVERNSQANQEIVRADREHNEHNPVALPSWWGELLSFIRGPAVGSIGSVTVIYFFIDPPFLRSSRYDPPMFVGKFLLMWLSLIILLSIAKGFLVILDYYLWKKRS